MKNTLNIKNIIPLIEDWWWLKDAYPEETDDFVRCVDVEGILDYYECNGGLGIRPALYIVLDTDKPFEVGSHIHIGSKSWTILDVTETPFDTELFVLCDTLLGEQCFDNANNNWETSELKEWLETKGLKLIF